MGSTGDAFGRDIVLKIRPPHEASEVPLLQQGARLISFLHPAQNKGLVDALAQKRVSALGAEGVRLVVSWCGFLPSPGSAGCLGDVAQSFSAG